VYDVGSFDAQVMAVAERLADGPPQAFAVAKELLNLAAGMDRLDGHLDRELEELARVANGSEFAEGIAAFLEKRAPRFGQEGPEGQEGREGRDRQEGWVEGKSFSRPAPPAVPVHPA
jgi:Enoyl-CoA hydratase/isomerase